MSAKKVPFDAPLEWVNLIFFIATPLVGSIALWGYLSYYDFSWSFVIAAAIYYFIGVLSITGGYHRLFSHKSYKARPIVETLFLILGAGTFQQSCLIWATDHRRHHRFVDHDEDPYNINEGFWWAHIGWIFHKTPPQFLGKFPDDLLQNKRVMWQHRVYLPLSITMAFLVPILIGWMLGNALAGFAIIGCFRLVCMHHATFFINSLCHMWGTQPYTDKNSARDSAILAIVTAGEGYHNFHHRFQSDYRNGHLWYQVDPTKWLIALLGQLRLAYDLKTIPSNVILNARIQHEKNTLIKLGVPSERLQVLMTKVDEAQAKFRALKLEYQKEYALFKANMQAQSRKKLVQLKAELKMAQLEFKMARSQWGVYSKTMRAFPL